MNIDLNKTLCHDMANRAGINALHQTLATARGPGLGDQIASDLTAMTTQAVNTLLKDPAKPGATIAMSQLVGYLGELASVVGILAEGHRFEVTADAVGDTSLTVK